MKLKPIKIVTHSGGFHTDDAFAVAALLLLHPDAKLVRTRDPKEMKNADYVVDVGGEYSVAKHVFDHHQTGGAGERSNGVPYAAFGLVWKEIGEKLCGSREVADVIDQKLVQSVDAFDNGLDLMENKIEEVHPYLMENITFSFEPTWQESERTTEEGFQEALVLAKRVLEREIVHAHAKVDGFKIIDEVYRKSNDKQIIVMEEKEYVWDRGLLTDAFVKYPDVLYVVRKHEGGQWQGIATVDDAHSFETRKPFPKSWAGKRDEELAKITGVIDAVFCHNKRFMIIAKSRESAIELAEKALKS